MDDFTKWYGDKILFAKVNGPANYYLTNTYKVQSFPTFVLMDLESKTYTQFNQERTYASMKDFLLKKLDGKI